MFRVVVLVGNYLVSFVKFFWEFGMWGEYVFMLLKWVCGVVFFCYCWVSRGFNFFYCLDCVESLDVYVVFF